MTPDPCVKSWSGRSDSNARPPEPHSADAPNGPRKDATDRTVRTPADGITAVSTAVNVPRETLRPSPPAWLPTQRQRLVLAVYVAAGKREEAAHRLAVSPSTVKATLERMRRAAGDVTTEQLVYIGAARGWLTVPELGRGRRRPREV